ncbi:protein NO VEIN domain-containing protein [Actinoplanes sp. URMC 104]|uniref:protein NO VEIN domain-containing protein n=1 Tax=Actinoplanes sp. URMC 104 TaxID=3423409 RepID=UPI003F1AC2AD
MAVNFDLDARRSAAPGDPRGRTWAGWDKHAGDDDLWEANRGPWTLAGGAAGERFATLSHDGIVQVVAEITGRQQYPPAHGDMWTLTGRVLRPGDPVRDELVGSPARQGSVSYYDTADLDTMTTSERAAVADRAPVTMLVTWNPARWRMGDYDDDVIATAGGGFVRGRWSTGSRTGGIEPGDRVFMLLQGDGPRGIVGSGTCASRIFQAGHWDPQRTGEQANYALIDWDTLVPLDDVLPRPELMEMIPAGGEWRPQSSGTLLSPEVAQQLEQLWAGHLGLSAPVPPRTSPRQGWQLDPVRRKKVEDAAQDRLTAHFRAQGWTVKDTRYGNPYDAVAKREGEIRYLEAKGTETAGAAVIVTPNEVAFARDHPGQCVMGILANVRFRADGEVDPASGAFRVLAWNPDAGDLAPRAYDWTAPPSA